MNGKRWVLAGVLLHGCSFTLVFITAQIYLEQRVDAAWRARAQALLTLMNSGVGQPAGLPRHRLVVQRLHAARRHAMVALLGRAGRGGRRGDGLLPHRLSRHRFGLPASEGRARSSLNAVPVGPAACCSRVSLRLAKSAYLPGWQPGPQALNWGSTSWRLARTTQAGSLRYYASPTSVSSAGQSPAAAHRPARRRQSNPRRESSPWIGLTCPCTRGAGRAGRR